MRTWITFALVAILAVGGVLGFGAWYYLLREVPDHPKDAEDLFKYGSIGAEGQSIPTAIWKALPEICADLLPGGWESLGFVYEPGADRPIGITERTVGVSRAAFNCATCHVGTVRESAAAQPTILLGAPAFRMDVQRYTRFLRDCIDSDRFAPDRAMPVIEKLTPLSPIEAAVFRYAIVPGTRREVAKLRTRFAWFDSRPDFGPGRFDDINPNKPDMSGDSTIGTADLVPIWNQTAHEGHARHWDGNATTLRESVLNSALAAGTPASALDVPLIERIEDYLKQLPAPKYPFAIDASLAARGESVFSAQCARCHGETDGNVGKVTRASDVGTDAHRAASYTQDAANITNAQGRGFPWEFTGYHPSDGYVNVLLDGLWARAPYLHNGSVPSLRDLLEPPDQRPKVFFRGYDVYDQQRVGFVSTGPDAERVGFKLDTNLPGNGNTGHVFGTDLAADEKSALLEYLKTK
jgi:mono/diheme cytochrome c family protein